MCLHTLADALEAGATQGITSNNHLAYMQLALAQAKQSPPKDSNFRVGAVLVDAESNTILTTGYTLELPGNTHAEQVCLIKYAKAHDVPEERVSEVLPTNTVIYTTIEPCAKRLSGKLPCVERILRTRKVDGEGGIRKVYVGMKEPEKFIKEGELKSGRMKLEDAGIECVAVPGLESEIMDVATTGHQ
ncbi:cytidine deaminase-like protein [Delitschia confertaspora ATCC 74209]|uniref:Cytidine deaminase-like protein n=1 Tax=Delitschia confertaspora ATCC 74209 TaxID=1513339 RepID=A0A9P4JQL3_9PLEO|nr:cytidine deaminase-like protein [Delitschia confertaspora ATCC 74209]